MTTLVFCRAPTLTSWAIRVATWSRWSHVALIEGDWVIDATPKRGVAVRPLIDFETEHDDAYTIDLPRDLGHELALQMITQVGKPYDWTAALGLGLHRNWQKDDAWFCSELVAWAYDRIERPLFRADSMHRVTPQHLFMLQANLLGQRQWP